MTKPIASLEPRRGWLSDCLRGVLLAVLAVGAMALIQCDRAPAQQAGSPTTSAKLVEDHSDFDRDGVADIGYIQPGSTHELSYRLQAPTDTAITELRIDSDCPCVQGLELPARLEASESVDIRIQFEAPEKVLRYLQDLVIEAKTGEERIEIWLTIDARLGLPLRATPEEIRCPAGQATTTEVELRNDGPESIKLIYALSDDPSIKASVPNTPLSPGGTCVLQVTTTADWPATGPARLRVKTTSETQPEVVIWIYPEDERD